MFKKLPSKKFGSTPGKQFNALVQRHPFLLFGLPFISMVVVGSLFLSPVTAQRYETFDRKRRFNNKQDAFDTSGLKRRKFDAREEYYRMAAKDLDNWEQRRVERLPGEPDGIL
ncbi:cytochrome c oxidase-like protein [Microthyrium microscopicum]|uniref:Cytochrome c oxidase assembly protein COX16, mitochondrial n=1 Tax=Microthyrium microscopicum TaxID=703497 RepID=A0A6A6UQE7_9PEZI|nr:cytochrome c oxidase-like protein [Microthyrium microscopicum]